MRIKFLNLFREKAQRVQIDTVGEFLPYGDLNAFPLKISKLVDDSTVASACRSTVSDFIEGEGFSDPAAGDQTINKRGDTFADFHRKNAESAAPFWGYAWLITYNAAGERTQVFSLNFENCRLGKPDSKGYISKVHYNPYFGTDLYKKEDTICYDVWTPDPEVVKAQMAEAVKKKRQYQGQVFYYGTTTAMNRFYPMPAYYSARFWMEVDRRIGEYHQKNLQNGFLQPIMMRVIGDPNAPSTDPKHANQEPVVTVGDAFDDDMAEEFSGSERVGHIMVTWASTKEEFPDLVAFPGNNQEGYMTALVSQFKDLISTAWGVPPILANILSGAQLGGDGNVIRASVKLMQQRVVRWHHNLEMNYKKVLGIDVKIIHYNPFPETATIDPQVWNALSQEEKRQWIKDNTEVNLLEITPEPSVPAPTPSAPVNRFSNVYYDTYPEKAKKNAAKAKKYQADKGQICQAKFSRGITDAIIDGMPISMKDISRIKNFLDKNEAFKNADFSTCEAVNYMAWGGEDMHKWATEKVKEVR